MKKPAIRCTLAELPPQGGFLMLRRQEIGKE
jgi:hypothetical protein